jgi:hypothetical protein
MPFDEVDDRLARREDAGFRDGSDWHAYHRRDFSRRYEQIGRDPTKDTPVVCHEFRVVYPAYRAPVRAPEDATGEMTGRNTNERAGGRRQTADGQTRRWVWSRTGAGRDDDVAWRGTLPPAQLTRTGLVRPHPPARRPAVP